MPEWSNCGGILATLGEDDDMFTAMMDVLRKAQAKAQERPVSERIQSTKLFVERKQKRGGQRETVVRATEALAAAVADQEQQEVLLADGERWLAELQQEEKAIPFPFKVDPQHVVPDVVEFKRMQDTIVRL